MTSHKGQKKKKRDKGQNFGRRVIWSLFKVATQLCAVARRNETRTKSLVRNLPRSRGRQYTPCIAPLSLSLSLSLISQETLTATKQLTQMRSVGFITQAGAVGRGGGPGSCRSGWQGGYLPARDADCVDSSSPWWVSWRCRGCTLARRRVCLVCCVDS